MTVPAPDLAIRVPCRAPACALRRSYILRCIVPGSPGPTFWWDPPLAATTYALLPTCTWARLRGWYVLVDADPDDLEPKAMREEAHRAHAGVPSDLRDCRNLIAEHKPLPAQRSVLAGHHRPALSSFFSGVCRKLSGLQN